MRGRKRGDVYVYDEYRVWRPHRRADWLTLFNGDDVVLHCRCSEIDDVELLR
ncbi:hypothetical protein [Microbispora sp. NPDC049633]|uniref:hypothetical protein n=1 Tax=Microbispora sp. NPDC049633 TaxID=3154355 RepID=UPI0034138039